VIENVWCPHCRMEALRLLNDGRNCDWCVERPGFGRPFDARSWPQIVARLEGRMADALRENAAVLADRSAT